MKLHKYLEYVDNENLKEVKFNSNEIKYLKDKSAFTTINNEYYVNFRAVKKLSDNEYIVFYDDIKCSTIQSLIKYTKASVQEAIDYLKNILDNAEKIHLKNNIIVWTYNDDMFAKQTLTGKFFKLHIDRYWYIMQTDFNLSYFEVELLTESVIAQYPELHNYNVATFT